MINISKLYCDQLTDGDWLRYGIAGSQRFSDVVPATAGQRKPIIVWNVTGRCNLKCIHCYNNSGTNAQGTELTTQRATEVLDDLAEYGVPSVLFSGGEPLCRQDLFELTGHAVDRGLRAVISTNGTLITPEKARIIKQTGVSYVGISLDGIGEVNDRFRGVEGAFNNAVAGIRNCADAGVKVGLRFTLTGRNVGDIEQLFDFFDREGIERACFYHLVPSGRGKQIFDDNLTHQQTRDVVDLILKRAGQFRDSGRKTDILTVDNHVDGVYVYLKLQQENPSRAADVWKLLVWNGGGLNSSGVGIGCIDFNGKVHADQFWGHYNLGDINEKKFSRIWSDSEEPLLKRLRNRRDYIKGRCRLCGYFDACGGSLRVRADLYFNDPWAPDPACYLTDDEIGLDKRKKQRLIDAGQDFVMPE